MAALALALDVRLGKPGAYVLHAQGRAPDAQDMVRGLRMARRAVHWLAGLALLACLAALGSSHG